MAKVTGPLMSISASGKLADSIVFFPWKGINCVRQWLKPANPQSWQQGDRRQFMGGVGRAVGKIQPGMAIATQLINLGLVVAPNTKQSFLVQYILDTYLTDYTSYATELAAAVAHTASLAFGTMATALSIVNFDLAYASVAAFDRKLGLYLIAKALIANNLTGTPYVSNITTWVAADVNGMVNDFTNV
jgi:hypothetical protein